MNSYLRIFLCTMVLIQAACPHPLEDGGPAGLDGSRGDGGKEDMADRILFSEDFNGQEKFMMRWEAKGACGVDNGKDLKWSLANAGTEGKPGAIEKDMVLSSLTFPALSNAECFVIMKEIVPIGASDSLIRIQFINKLNLPMTGSASLYVYAKDGSTDGGMNSAMFNFSKNLSSWSRETFSFPVPSGTTGIMLSFGLKAATGGMAPGWRIDDLVISSSPKPL